MLTGFYLLLGFVGALGTAPDDIPGGMTDFGDNPNKVFTDDPDGKQDQSTEKSQQQDRGYPTGLCDGSL